MKLQDKRPLPASEQGPAAEPAPAPKPAPVALPPPPDGGMVAWMQVVGCWCLWFATWGSVNSFGVFQAYYQEHLLRDESASQISWIGSIQLFLFIAGTIAIGPLYDIGKLRILLLLGSFLTVFGMMMTSICKRYWEFMLAQGVCMGLGMTSLFLPSIALIPSYFSKKRALAAGICATGSSIGAILFAVIFEQLAPHAGFGWATRTIGLLQLVSLILPILALRKRAAYTPRRALVDKSAFMELPFLSLAMVMVLVFVGQYIPYYYLEVYSLQKNVLNGSSVYLNKWLIIFLNCGSFIGRLLPNFLADKIGTLNMIIICTIITGVIAFTWIAVHDLAGIVCFAVFYGFFSGSFVSLAPVSWAVICPNMKVFGTWSGMLAVCMAIGLLIGNPIAGALIRNDGTDFGPLQNFCGATVLAAALFLVFVRVAKSGRGLMVKA